MTSLSFSGFFFQSFFYDGTPIAKYYAKQAELERVHEEEVFDYMDSVLFGDGKIEDGDSVKLAPSASAEEGAEVTEKIFTWDKWVVGVAFVFVWLMMAPQVHRLRVTHFGYLCLAFYLATVALFKGINGGAAFSELAIPASATRWGACLALFVWLWVDRKPASELKTVKAILILAVSLTFFAHGYEAFKIHPHFRDLLYGSLEAIGIALNETLAVIILKSIGVMDILLALIILFHRHRMVLLWMAIWGGLTAFSRPVALGSEMWMETLLRTTNFGVPFILFLLYRSGEKKQKKHPSGTVEQNH